MTFLFLLFLASANQTEGEEIDPDEGVIIEDVYIYIICSAIFGILAIFVTTFLVSVFCFNKQDPDKGSMPYSIKTPLL